MNRSIFLFLLLLSSAFLFSSEVDGQDGFVPAPASLAGQDYFSAMADQDSNVREYLRLVTLAHVETIPKWMNQGRMNDALADLRYALDRFPNHPLALQQLSMVTQIMKKPGVATSYFERAVTLYPQYAITRVQYGLFLVSIDRVDEGIDRFKQATTIDPKLAAAYAGLARAYQKKNDLAHAREAATKARELGFTAKLID